MEGKKEVPERSGKTQLEEIREMLGKCLQQQSTLLQRQAEDSQTVEQILLRQAEDSQTVEQILSRQAEDRQTVEQILLRQAEDR
jgi:hypothetical protein